MNLNWFFVHFPQVFGDDEERMEKWVRKMYNFRQKTFAGTNWLSSQHLADNFERMLNLRENCITEIKYA